MRAQGILSGVEEARSDLLRPSNCLLIRSVVLPCPADPCRSCGLNILKASCSLSYPPGSSLSLCPALFSSGSPSSSPSLPLSVPPSLLCCSFARPPVVCLPLPPSPNISLPLSQQVILFRTTCSPNCCVSSAVYEELYVATDFLSSS